jgi:hypothetical protein
MPGMSQRYVTWTWQRRYCTYPRKISDWLIGCGLIWYLFAPLSRIKLLSSPPVVNQDSNSEYPNLIALALASSQYWSETEPAKSVSITKVVRKGQAQNDNILLLITKLVYFDV